MASSSAVSAGDTVLATQYNNLRTDVLGTAARVYQGANQSFAHSVAAVVAFGAERFDTGTYHDNSTNNSRLTTAKAGIYIIGGNCDNIGNDTGLLAMSFWKNGSSITGAGNRAGLGDAHLDGVSATFVDQAAAADYYEIQVTQYQASGTSAQNIDAITFWIAQIAVI